MPDHDLKTLCYFDGDALDSIVSELIEYAGAPSRRLKIKTAAHGPDHMKKFWLQACTDTEGGDDQNASKPCPGSPGCP